MSKEANVYISKISKLPTIFRFSEHYENVKKFHENLQHKLQEYAAQRGETYVPSSEGQHAVNVVTHSVNDTSIGPSKSILVTNLRYVSEKNCIF